MFQLRLRSSPARRNVPVNLREVRHVGCARTREEGPAREVAAFATADLCDCAGIVLPVRGRQGLRVLVAPPIAQDIGAAIGRPRGGTEGLGFGLRDTCPVLRRGPLLQARARFSPAQRWGIESVRQTPQANRCALERLDPRKSPEEAGVLCQCSGSCLHAAGQCQDVLAPAAGSSMDVREGLHGEPHEPIQVPALGKVIPFAGVVRLPVCRARHLTVQICVEEVARGNATATVANDVYDELAITFVCSEAHRHLGTTHDPGRIWEGQDLQHRGHLTARQVYPQHLTRSQVEDGIDRRSPLGAGAPLRLHIPRLLRERLLLLWRSYRGRIWCIHVLHGWPRSISVPACIQLQGSPTLRARQLLASKLCHHGPQPAEVRIVSEAPLHGPCVRALATHHLTFAADAHATRTA
mmetsp:Transcript_43408/g.108998  ORF Transcript_43408/g.108998 Transcript_43408/m.108998 type:complete len:409 (-) Transcript_43408:235-1461(-)